MQWLKTLDKKLTNFANNPNPKNFQDLAPTINLKSSETYTNAINWAVRNPEIKNIGLTGPYGSGKSSVLKTFISAYPEYKYLNISLASFDDETGKNGSDQQLIELSIMQQIFYHERAKDIPDSRFKRISSTSPAKLVIATVAILLCVHALLYFIKPALFTDNQHLKPFYTSNESLLFFSNIAVVLVGGFFFVRYLLKLLTKTRLEKLNITSGEFEISEKSEPSILNKHIDEIIYFFEQTPYEVVIIEDLDRFKDPDIFTKLREINLVLNSSKQINRKITFVYAIKDEMFLLANRTKFFDFIVPVIPVINVSNSNDILAKRLKTTNASNNISQGFVDDVAMYIEDMRMLINISNEFELYKDKIGLSLNHEKLLAMIIYKNIYPADFAALHGNKGFVYEWFASKPTLVKKRLDEIFAEIKQNENEIQALRNLLPAEIHQFRAIYIGAIIEAVATDTNIAGIVVDGNNHLFGHLNNEATFKSLKASNRAIQFFYRTNYTNNSPETFSTIEKKVDPQQTYDEKEQLLRKRNDNGITRLQQNIARLSEEANSLQGNALADLLELAPYAVIPENLKDKALLVYLIRNGYIDEMYASYISYFYEGSMTRADADFVMSIKNRMALSPEFKLNKPAQVMLKLRPKEFNQKEVLNHSLTDHLLQDPKSNQQALHTFIGQLSNESDYSKNFIESYVNSSGNAALLMPMLCRAWPRIWTNFVEGKEFTQEKKDRYLQLILKNASIEDIKKINWNDNLATYICHASNFLLLFPDAEGSMKIEEVITELNVEFGNLVYSSEAEQLFEYIYENSIYEINTAMVQFMLERKRGAPTPAQLKLHPASLTRVLSSECTFLIDYIKMNLQDYVENILLPDIDISQESTEAVLLILNDDNVKLDFKRQVLSKAAVLEVDISNLRDDIWPLAIKLQKIEGSWQNIVLFYNRMGEIDQYLINFLNNPDNYFHAPLLLEESQKSRIENWESKQDELYVALLECAALTDNSYAALLKQIDWGYDELDFFSVGTTKTRMLIDTGTIHFTVSNFDTVRLHYKELVVPFILKNLSVFLANLGEYVITSENLRLLLGNDSLSTDNRLSLALLCTAEWIKQNHGLKDSVLGQIISRPEHGWPYGLLEAILSTMQVDEQKVQFVTMLIPHVSFQEIMNLLLAMGEPFAELARGKRKKIKIEATSHTLTMAEALVKKNLISSFRMEGKHLTVWVKAAH